MPRKRQEQLPITEAEGNTALAVVEQVEASRVEPEPVANSGGKPPDADAMKLIREARERVIECEKYEAQVAETHKASKAALEQACWAT